MSIAEACHVVVLFTTVNVFRLVDNRQATFGAEAWPDATILVYACDVGQEDPSVGMGVLPV